jgi:hypothetical protein
MGEVGESCCVEGLERVVREEEIGEVGESCCVEGLERVVREEEIGEGVFEGVCGSGEVVVCGSGEVVEV